LFDLQELWSRTGALQVADTYGLAHQKSPSTAYRLLISLKSKGLIDLQVDTVDKRERHIHFTQTAQKLFDALG
jgi:DNA-binding PadR family transcriptional regulator